MTRYLVYFQDENLARHPIYYMVSESDTKYTYEEKKMYALEYIGKRIGFKKLDNNRNYEDQVEEFTGTVMFLKKGGDDEGA